MKTRIKRRLRNYSLMSVRVKRWKRASRRLKARKGLSGGCLSFLAKSDSIRTRRPTSAVPRKCVSTTMYWNWLINIQPF